MLFCRSVAVLFSLIGVVWCATTPVQRRGGRTPTTVQPDDYPLLRGEVSEESSTAWIASSDSGNETDDIETNADEVSPPERHSTSSTPLRGTSKTVPTDDYSSSDDSDVTAWIGASSDSGTEKDGTASETINTDDVFPPERHTTTFFRSTTEDEFRTRRGIVIVDDDFNNVSPESSQGWSDSTKTSSSSSTIDEGSGQEETSVSPTSSPDTDGSGDDSTEPWINSCFNSTCDSRDMSVFPGHDEMVPVGTNLSLSCLQSNESAAELRWYKYDDDSSNPLLHSTKESELTFTIYKSGTEDSGRYVCLRGDSASGSCCHRTLHLKVYEVPNYRYHLIVVGVVAAVSLFACLLIGVCRNYKTKKYEVQLELQNVESDCVYKM